MDDVVVVSGLQLVESVIATANVGVGDLVLASDDEVVSLSFANGCIVRASSASTHGTTFLGMAERARVITADAAAAVKESVNPVAELIASGVLTQQAVHHLSCIVAAVDLGRLLQTQHPLRLIVERAVREETGEGIRVVEFMKQAVIVGGDVGSMLASVRVLPSETVHRGTAFAAPLDDERSRRMLTAIEDRLPLAVHEVLGLAGDDLTRRKLAASLVIVLATGHLKRGPAVAPNPVEALPRLSSLTGVMSLDLSAVPPPAPALPAWRKETLKSFVDRRAADLHIDPSTPDNAASLEREYLALVVPRGLAAGATAELVAEATRWQALAPNDPVAAVAAARVRWTQPALRGDVVAALAKASAAFPTLIEVQLALFDMALEAAAAPEVAVARRRFLAVAAKTHPRHAEIAAARRRPGEALDIDVASLGRAAAAVVLVPLLTGLALAGHLAEDVSYHPASLPWVLRHGVLIVAAVALLLAGGAQQRAAAAEALKNVQPMWLVIALLGGAAAQLALFILFGSAQRPDDLVFAVALATGIAHSLVERCFFHLAIVPLHQSTAAAAAMSVLGHVLLVGTYLALLEDPAKLVMWSGIVVVSVAIPTSLLWIKSRSFWVPVAWQIAMVGVQLALLR